MNKTFIIGTRGSELALFQSNLVKELLEKNYPKYNFVLKKIKTKGDILIDKALDRKIDKGFFVNEIQKMLINEEIHIAVHSLKDLPVESNENLLISAILALIISNSYLSEIYFETLNKYLFIGINNFGLKLSVLHWINDALMAIFFFFVTLEIKR